MEAEDIEIDVTSLGTTDRRIHDTQVQFLEAYAKVGTILRAAKASGINRSTFYAWHEDDKLGFQARFQGAKENFREEIEDLFFQRLRDPNAAQ